MQEAGHDPVLHEVQSPVGLPRGQEMPGRAPCVPRALEPFRCPQLKRLLAVPVPGPQLGAQHPAHQMVVPEARPLVIERRQEQVGRVNAVQQHLCVLPRGDGCARVRGQLPQDRRIEHEPDDLGRLLVKDFGDEVLDDRVAADLQCPRGPHRVGGAAQRKRRHLQRRGPSLAALMKQRKLGSTDLDAEVGQQAAALGQGEMQVMVAKLAQLTGNPQPVQPQRRVHPAGQHQLGDLGRPALDKISHGPGDPGRRGMEVVDHDRRPCGQLRGIVGDRRDDIGRHVAVHREQVGGIGAEPRRHRLGGLDETGPEADRVSVGLIAGQPGSSAWWSCRRPA